MRITSFNKDVKNISSLSDRPNIESGYTAQALKETFDKAGVDIKEYINNVLIEELASGKTGASGADRIGSGVIATVPGTTVQEKLEELSNQINGFANMSVPDGSLTASKLAPEVADFLENASYRALVFTEPGEHSFKIERTGTYKITAVGGGAGGGVLPSDVSRRLGGGAGASSVDWITLAEGTECLAIVGNGGKGLTIDGERSLASHAQDGEETCVKIGDDKILGAGGGKFGFGVRALAENGKITYSGGYPKMSAYSEDEMQFAIGGDSILGFGGAFEGDSAGVGGGGYAGKHVGNGKYNQGYNGGNGAVIVEFIK